MAEFLGCVPFLGIVVRNIDAGPNNATTNITITYYWKDSGGTNRTLSEAKALVGYEMWTRCQNDIAGIDPGALSAKIVSTNVLKSSASQGYSNSMVRVSSQPHYRNILQ